MPSRGSHLAGSEVFLLDTLRGGGVGCITATGNVNPTGIRKVFENWETPEADAPGRHHENAEDHPSPHLARRPQGKSSVIIIATRNGAA